MAERTIVGVDFSGAETEGKTWLCEGKVRSPGQVTIERVQPVLRNDLAEFLYCVPFGTVVALDFPFSLPKVFLDSLDIRVPDMKQVWPRIAEMPFAAYKKACSGFGRHPKRKGDNYYNVSLSALNTRLVPMTYRGIELLNNLNSTRAERWWVPPLNFGEPPDDRITLLEVMPGAFLWSIGFDHSTVKGYKNAKDSLVTRNLVIDNLSEFAKRANVNVANLDDFRKGFKASDDLLDCVVAALAAASWATSKGLFLHPSSGELPDARLEGWIYAPRK